MCFLALSAGGGDPDGPGPGGGVGEPACGGKGGGREEEEEEADEEEEQEDEEEERHNSRVPVCACGPGNRRRTGLAPKRGSVMRSGTCVLCRGPADRTGRGKDWASRTENCSPVVETGVCHTGASAPGAMSTSRSHRNVRTLEPPPPCRGRSHPAPRVLPVSRPGSREAQKARELHEPDRHAFRSQGNQK